MKCEGIRWEDHTNYDDFVADPYPPLTDEDKDLRPVRCGGELKLYDMREDQLDPDGKDFELYYCQSCNLTYLFQV